MVLKLAFILVVGIGTLDDLSTGMSQQFTAFAHQVLFSIVWVQPIMSLLISSFFSTTVSQWYRPWSSLHQQAKWTVPIVLRIRQVSLTADASLDLFCSLHYCWPFSCNSAMLLSLEIVLQMWSEEQMVITASAYQLRRKSHLLHHLLFQYLADATDSDLCN